MAAHGAFQQCQTGLRPPPDERDHTSGSNNAALTYRVKLDETGIYDGKVEPQCTNALHVER